MANKRYYCSIHDHWKKNADRKLVHVKGVLNKVVDKVQDINSQLVTNAPTKACNETADGTFHFQHFGAHPSERA